MKLEKIVENYYGWKNCKIIEQRDDPKVDGVVAVRVTFEDAEFKEECGEHTPCCLINSYFNEVTDEFGLEEGQKSLYDIPVGEPRFF